MEVNIYIHACNIDDMFMFIVISVYFDENHSVWQCIVLHLLGWAM